MTMSLLLAAGLMLGAAAAAQVPPVDHVVRVDHDSGPVDARYNGNVAMTYRQVGATAPGGRPSTLRCLWSADMVVDRQARAISGSTLARSFSRQAVMNGSRHGWCDAHRAAIDQEVAARRDDLHGHVRAMAAEDHEILRHEIDRLHTPVRTG
ncbi:hypothetical protein Q5H91_04325 [Sphingomonas sp. KR1UV-12]|uniref:UrcA family protein n=1 Tax=Sphingomonas aurea TaxID=3063994 RepID=A0ABT9EHY8_9SPHN|nr:hypothetical protein [Sphingomonas sp. KR1UV-12]MDP1026428.1 hypothetical protein [Sphingomonas sp. KR1UV-12]